jgi:TRAP-type transport system periplasmic protein
MFKFLLLLVLLSSNAYSSKKLIRFASLAPDGSTWTEMLKKFAKELEDEKKFKFRIFPGGISGDEFDVIRRMRMGTINTAGFTGVGLGQILPAVRILDLPMLYESYEEIDYINEKLRPYFENEFLKKGFVFLAYSEVGYVNLFSTKKYNTLDAMRGMKMWVWDSDPLAKAMFNELKIVPNPLPITDVFTSLETGLIESVYVSPLAAVAMQWFTKTKHMITLKLTNSSGAILMTKKFFDTYSKDEQAFLKEKFLEFSKEINQASRKDNDLAYETLKKNNVEFIDLDQEQVSIFENSSISLWNKMAGDLYPKDLLQKVLNYRKNFRDLKAKEKKKDDKVEAKKIEKKTKK